MDSVPGTRDSGRTNNPVKIREITEALEAWAPKATQQSYDNVGLQVGDPDHSLSLAITALDLTPAVVDEAIRKKAELIITHHPLIFRPLRSVTTRGWHGALIHRLIRNDIALYCIHTNLDAAHGGVSFALAERLGLDGIGFLRPTDDVMVKLATFVPASHADGVQRAMGAAGAGRIGDYEACAFVMEGTGYFKPGDKATPAIGEAGGELESVDERRIEVELPRWLLPQVVRALQNAHPYEEVAYDVYPMHKADTWTGMGAIGDLPEPEPLDAFLARAANALSANGLQYVGHLEQSIRRVAVCGGSGSDLIDDAMSAGADAYLTADITYHRFFEVLDPDGHPRMALINADHYDTEQCVEDLLVDWLSARFEGVTWEKTEMRTGPIEQFRGKGV